MSSLSVLVVLLLFRSAASFLAKKMVLRPPLRLRSLPSSENPFVEHKAAAEFAESLLRATPVDYDKELGLELLKLDYGFPEVPASKNIFSRKHTRELLGVLLHRMRLHAPPILALNNKAAIDILVSPDNWTKEEAELAGEDDGRAHAVIEGAPGIGKSFSLLWLLRVLLQRGEHVVFHSMRTYSVYQFVPPRENDGFSAEQHFDEGGRPRYRVFRCAQKHFDPVECAALFDPRAFYLFDPMEKTGEAERIAAHTVTAASPNRAHYTQRNSETDEWYFMSPWTLPEVLAAAPIVGEDRMVRNLRKNMTDEARLKQALEERVRDAFYVCGGSLRNIFPRSLSEILDNQQSTIEATSGQENAAAEKLFHSFGEIDGELIPEKSSRLFAYHSKFPFTRDNKWRTFVSRRVSHNLIKKHKNVIMFGAHKLLSEKKNRFAGNVFEEVCLALLCLGGDFWTRIAPVRTLHEEVSERNSTVISLKTVEEKHLPCTIGLVRNLTALCASLPSVEEQEKYNLPRIVYAPEDPNFALLDFVDARNRGYQITVSEDHKIKGHALHDFLKAVGATDKEPFHLYLVVPSIIGHKEDLTQSIEGIRDLEKTHPEKYHYIKESLEHHVLIIDEIVEPK